ncbi:GRAM domain-containing protein 4 [Chelonia mydas]|uniref:GRAM domain-containing protein 4 n=1 Tax=Chelonia mydas TaxID=8469 RepID=M7B0N8_CHEMY|nr:GRAM domain-containing protein 4 [Chelonia mydas]
MEKSATVDLLYSMGFPSSPGSEPGFPIGCSISGVYDVGSATVGTRSSVLVISTGADCSTDIDCFGTGGISGPDCSYDALSALTMTRVPAQTPPASLALAAMAHTGTLAHMLHQAPARGPTLAPTPHLSQHLDQANLPQFLRGQEIPRVEEELRKLREETNAETLKQELEKERQRRLELEQKVNEVLKTRTEELPTTQQPAKPPTQVNGTDKRSQMMCSRVQKWFYDKFGEYVEDFRFQPEENTVETEEPLSARRLTENMRRLKRGAKPVTNFVKNLSALSDWYSIYTSAIAFIEPPKEDLTVSEKFQLVLDVAQKAQIFFNCSGLYAGIKFFLIDFIFKRCPRLRAKYDTPYIIWTNLPTDPQLKERSNATVSRRVQTASSRSCVGSGAPAGVNKDEDSSRFHTTKRGNFYEVFNLSENERPLAVCENGWRCCLINRDKKMPTDYIRNGVLYVTENYLCFESSKSGSSKRNKVIKLTEITDIQKYKVLSVLPGSGMGIAVSTPATQKPLVFGAMVHRDEAFETIFNQYVKIISAASNSES